jgi:peptidoglycan-associated lipoprotein
MKKYNIIIILIYFLSATLLSGCAELYKQKADKNFEGYRYQKAIRFYNKSLDRRELPGARQNLAEAYLKVNNTEAAEEEYKIIVNSESCRPEDRLNYARMLMSNQKYEEAENVLRAYLKERPGDKIAGMMLGSCNSVSDRKIDTSLYTLKVVSLPGMTNSFSPVVYKDGIVFTADKPEKVKSKQYQWTGESYLDLYYMEKDASGNWKEPEMLKGDISGKFHQGTAAFNSTGDVVYFTGSNYKNKNRLAETEDRFSNLHIYSARLVEGEWTNIEELPFNSEDYSVGHPSLAPDDMTLYFVSDMPGGFGGTDIYESKLENGHWTRPQNLGPVVNTQGNEMFPYIAKNGVLYFSSNAHNSMGGLDVFMTYNNGEGWTEPENLNYPLNSKGDDFGYVLTKDGKAGYVSSSRNSSDKLYQFEKHDPTLTLQGLVTIKGKGTPIEGAKVTLYNQSRSLKEETFTDNKGHYFFALGMESDYKIMVTKEMFFTANGTVSTMGQKISKEYFRDFELEQIVIQKPIVLENIYYDFDKWEIRPDAAKELDKFVVILNDNPRIRIELGSHTDCRGTYKYNMVLSDKRAKSAVEYLVSRGIAASRMTWKGYGESVPVNECRCEPDKVGPGATCTEEQHQQNRRTEFKVIEVKKQALNE